MDNIILSGNTLNVKDITGEEIISWIDCYLLIVEICKQEGQGKIILDFDGIVNMGESVSSFLFDNLDISFSNRIQILNMDDSIVGVFKRGVLNSKFKVDKNKNNNSNN